MESWAPCRVTLSEMEKPLGALIREMTQPNVCFRRITLTAQWKIDFKTVNGEAGSPVGGLLHLQVSDDNSLDGKGASGKQYSGSGYIP